MDKSDYIDTLKTIDLRPGKVRVSERKEQILMEQDENFKLHESIIKWFMEHPYPKDEDVHKFASEMGMDEHEFENHIYSILSSVLSEGKSKGKNANYDPEQIKMGIKVEMEHTTNPIISEKIAWDHLAEIPDYYTRLAKMEKEAGVDHHSED
jgi:hypothetical protein